MPDFVRILKQADIFYQFTATQLELVSNLCGQETFNTGDIILEENAASDELYVIAEGEVEFL